MVEVRKRDNEGTDSLIRRFSRRVYESGVLIQAKKVRFREQKKNKRRMREDAQRKAGITAERDRLIKLGEIDEFSTYPYNKKKN